MFSMDQISFIVAIIANAVLWYLMIRLSKWNKRIELTSLYMKRFDDLIKDEDVVNKKEMSPVLWWKRFWYLQQEQYLFRGSIDKKIFKIWMGYRKKEWEKDWQVGDIGVRKSWKDISNDLLLEFKNFMKKECNFKC